MDKRLILTQDLVLGPAVYMYILLALYIDESRISVGDGKVLDTWTTIYRSAWGKKHLFYLDRVGLQQ